jgi:hypothetical protein
VFRSQHYDKIVTALGGLRLGGNIVVNVEEGCMRSNQWVFVPTQHVL